MYMYMYACENFTQHHEVPNNYFPYFTPSSRLPRSLLLNSPPCTSSGTIPVVPLNYTTLSNGTPWGRTTVETCIHELLQAVSRCLGAGKTVELDFTGLGRLLVKEKKVKMKFFKEFIRSMDTSGSMENAFVSET